MIWTVKSDGSVIDQQYIDQYVLETENLVDKVCDEDSAMELFKRIDYLHYVSKSFFVPAIVFSWEEMALSYIESDKAIFDCIHYPHIEKTHKEGIETFKSLERIVLEGGLSEKILFKMVQQFNRGVSYFNSYCQKYQRDTFQEYSFNDYKLKEHFNKWEVELND